MNIGWSKKSIGEITQVKGGKRVPKGYKLESTPTKHPYLSVSDFTDEGTIDRSKLKYINDKVFNLISRYTISSKDIYLSIAGTIGKTGIVPKDLDGANLTENACKLVLSSEIYQKFLYYFTTSEDFKKQAGLNTRKTAQPKLALERLKTISLPIPPLEEQKRIVAILDEAFAGIDNAIANTQKNLANARELFGSFLSSIFSQVGDEWVHTSIGNVVENRILSKPLDGNHGEIHPKKSDFVKSGIPFVMASDLIDGNVDQENCNFISKSQADSLRKGFAIDGDVLLSHKGTIGRTAVLNTSHEYVMLTPQITYYRISDKGSMYNRYLYYYFQSASFQNEINRIAGAGSTRAYIGITRQLELPISYPGLELQKSLATRFDSLVAENSRLENIYHQKLSSLKELKQSLLQKAFSGELISNTDEIMDEAVAWMKPKHAPN